MSLSICSLASGSSGNCYVVFSEDTALLVDAGISGKQIRERLVDKGLDPECISAVLVTHEHSDHIQGLPIIAKLGCRIYATSKTAECFSEKIPAEQINCFCAGETFEVGSIKVESFSVSHDAADPVGYSFTDGALKIAIVTDTGIATPAVKSQMDASDILVLESNHDVNVLKMGPYPWFLKQRILSDHGHLSNEAAALALAEVMQKHPKPKRVLLAHLSKENNFPEMALATVENICLEQGVSPKLLKLETLSRSAASQVFKGV